MTMDLDQIEVRQTIDETGRGDPAHASKIVLVNFIHAASDKLPRSVRNRVEHFLGIIEVMDRAKNEIEFVPIFLDPISSRDGSLRIVVELYARANFHILVGR